MNPLWLFLLLTGGKRDANLLGLRERTWLDTIDHNVCWLAFVVCVSVCSLVLCSSCNSTTYAVTHPASVYRANREANEITTQKNEDRINQELSDLTNR